MLFFICHTHIPGRIFLFLIICEYFCRRFTGGIFNYRQDESTNINKRERGKRKVALYHAFHTSLPIMAGYGFLGLTYGIYMHELGFNFLYPMLLAITVYAGSAEFLLGNMLLDSFHPLQTLLMVLMVNARHLFYGLSMLEKYKGLGWKKFFLIFGMSG